MSSERQYDSETLRNLQEQLRQKSAQQMQQGQGSPMPARSVTPTPPPVTPMPVTPPVQQTPPTMAQPVQAPSATDSMRARMRAARDNAPQEQVVLQQGDTYNPTSNGSTSTMINNTKRDVAEVPAPTIDTGDKPEKKKTNPTIAIVIVGVVILLGVLLLLFTKKPEESIEDPTTVEDPVDNDDLVWIDPGVTYNAYTADEVAALRAAGYTGDEIEQFAASGVLSSDKIKEAEAARDAFVQEAIAPLYDATSQEYKDFINQTWLTLPKRNDTDEWSEIAGYYIERKNLDYEKVDVYGNQLFIKVYLDDDTHKDWFFLNITPEEWNKLKASGNVIVNYTYCTRYVTSVDGYLTEDFSNIFITEATLEIIE